MRVSTHACQRALSHKSRPNRPNNDGRFDERFDGRFDGRLDGGSPNRPNNACLDACPFTHFACASMHLSVHRYDLEYKPIVNPEFPKNKASHIGLWR